MNLTQLLSIMTTGYMATNWPYAFTNWLGYVNSGNEACPWWTIYAVQQYVTHDDYAWICNSMLNVWGVIDETAYTTLMTQQPAMNAPQTIAAGA